MRLSPTAANILSLLTLWALLGCGASSTATPPASAQREARASLSVGEPFGGALVEGVRMPEGEHWTLVDPERAWATQETVSFLVRAITLVEQRCPPTHKLFIGHLSRQDGGPLWPHKSHQSGRDVDLSFYYQPSALIGWYQRANRHTLDAPRTWTLLRALITETPVEYLFIDRSVQRLLLDHARASGEDPEWLKTVFQVGSAHPEPLIRHAFGHATHMHVRFFNPEAQARGARAHASLLERGVVGGRRHPRLRPSAEAELPSRPAAPPAPPDTCAPAADHVAAR